MFVIVAVYSLLVGLMMLVPFVIDCYASRSLRRRLGAQLGGDNMQMSEEAEIDDAGNSLTPRNTTSRCEDEMTVVTTTAPSVDTFCIKIALLFVDSFVFWSLFLPQHDPQLPTITYYVVSPPPP